VVTTVAIASSNLAPNYGASVTLTATVAPAPKDSPAGTVNFYSGAGLGRAGTLLGTSAVGAGGVATLTIALPLGQDTLTTVYSGSADFAPSASAALPVSNRAVTTLNFSVAPTTQLFNNPIVLTAQVASAAPESATGTVTFLDGTAVIATAAVGTAGIAAASESTLADGQHNLTATYSGDSTFQPGASSGAGISITISDLDLALGGDNNQTVLPGAAVTYNFPLSPLVTPTFLYEVTLTANGLPPGATYTFSPASIPAGSGPLGVAFTVQTAKPVALGRPGERGRTWYALALGMLLPLAAAKRFRKRLRSGVILLVALSLGGAAGLGGCGSGGFLGTPVGKTSYTITIVASSADLVRTSTVQLNFK
jgi:hypothetical protein